MEKNPENNGDGQDPTFETLHQFEFVGKIRYFCHMITKDIPFIDIHTHRHCELAMTFGVHPWWLDNPDYQPAQDLFRLETLLKENKIAAIGETGIDRLHKETIDLQIEVFEQHIRLSEQYQKPLIIHNVKGTADILLLHKKYQPRQAWIIHGFNGNESEIHLLINKGIFLSVGESIFYENRKIAKSISSIPLDHLFLETDMSEKTIQEIYEKVAKRLNLPLDVLKERIFANFARLNLDVWNNGMTEPDCSSAIVALRNLDKAMC